MPSLDFVTDLTDKLKSQKIDYAIITVQRGGKKSSNKVHLFHSIPDMESVECVSQGFLELAKMIKILNEKYGKKDK